MAVFINGFLQILNTNLVIYQIERSHQSQKTELTIVGSDEIALSMQLTVAVMKTYFDILFKLIFTVRKLIRRRRKKKE